MIRLRTLVALAALPLLSGCIAVAALPVLAGGAMFAGGNVKIRAATPRPKTSGTVQLAPASEERTAGAAVVTVPGLSSQQTAPGAGVGLETPGSTAAEPTPGTATTFGPWADFLEFAARKATQTAGKAPDRSVLLEAGTSLVLPRMRTCASQNPAVLIDLDTGPGKFTPGKARNPPPGLAEGLAKLRTAGIVVLWISALPGGEVGAVAEDLRNSGLDPEGKDPLLLVRSRDDRKQVLREEANRDVCVIAIAGDRKGDFDELFDYLRDQRSGESLEYLMGSGWFIVPPPL